MRVNKFSNLVRAEAWCSVLALLLVPLLVLAQGSKIEMPKNKFTVAQDVQLGREAAAEVERQMPLLPENGDVDDYVERVGARLVSAIPSQFQHREFNYEFDVVNARDINAFALPGGPLYVNRGMIEKARNEGELAGVLAHEVSHTALRHGTAQATKAQSWKFQLPAIGGAILGAIIGGNVGGVIAQGTQFGLSAYFLKFSRDYERQADLLGAQIMARAGYDPRDLANVFRTIEGESGSGGPEWLSSHPNPGDRYDRIVKEAQRLNVNPARTTQDTAAFDRIQADLRRMSPAPTMEEIARSGKRSPQGDRRYPDESRIETRVEPPSRNYRTYTGSNVFRINVPDNWREFPEQTSVTFAPPGAFGNYQEQAVFTHGVIVGVVNAQSRDLRQATDRYINSLLQNNQYLDTRGNYRRAKIDRQSALRMTLEGRAPATGRVEQVQVYTTMLRDGNLFYVISVVPRDQAREYNRTFRNVLSSIDLNV
jgi:beta-barrel assembly-enhancing protease